MSGEDVVVSEELVDSMARVVGLKLSIAIGLWEIDQKMIGLAQSQNKLEEIEAWKADLKIAVEELTQILDRS